MTSRLAQGALPDATLIDQIMVVINNLISVAAEQSLELASDAEISEIRSLVKPLMEDDLNPEAHTLARFELMQSIMLASRNLPLRLIARTLFEQVAPNMTELHAYAVTDGEAYSIFARQLDNALEQRDQVALRATFAAFSNLNRETMMRAFTAASADLGQEAISS